MFFLGSAEARDDLTPLINTPSANASIGGDACVVIRESANKCPASTSWIIDSGATHHFTNDAAAILNPSPSSLRVRVANGSVLQATSKCSVFLKTITNGKVNRFVLTYVYYIPTMPRNLLSGFNLIDHDFVVSFSGHCTISTNNRIVARAPRESRLWSLSAVTDIDDEATAFLARIESSTLRQ